MQTPLPESIRPLLWYLRQDRLDIEKDKHDIIVNVINDGTMEQWRWLMDTYGSQTIREVLKEHLPTEFHPESRNLASVVFDATQYHAPRNIDGGGAPVGSWPRRI